MSDSKSYLLNLDSRDKISGKNNDANFNINWDSFLPRIPTQYEVSFLFQSAGGSYADAGKNNLFSSCNIKADFTKNSKTFDSTTNSKSDILGFGRRTIQSGYSEYSSIFEYNPKKVISTPNQNLVNFQITNTTTGLPLYDNMGVYNSTIAVANTSGSNIVTVTLASLSYLQVGQAVSGAGIQTHSTIIYISGLTVGLSKVTTSAVTSMVVITENNQPTFPVNMQTVTNTIGNATVTFTVVNPYLKVGQKAIGAGVATDTVILSIAGNGLSCVLSKLSTSAISSMTILVDNTTYFSIPYPLIGYANVGGTPTLTTVAGAGYLSIGQSVIGAGIPSGTTITSISGATVTLSKNVTALTAIALIDNSPQDMTSWNMILKFTPIQPEL